MKSELEVLRDARELLAQCYVKWTVDDDAGGHCAMGCVNLARVGYASVAPVKGDNALDLVNRACERLHPELQGKRAPRMEYYDGIFMDCGHEDFFDTHPMVFVNNQLGKEAILACFDDAILHEEMRVMLENVQAQTAESPGQILSDPEEKSVALLG